MDDDSAFNQVPGCDLVPVATVFCEFSFLDQLIEDVFNLFSRPGGRIKVVEDAVQVRPTVRRSLEIFDQVFCADVLFRPSAASPTPLLPHDLSLLTSWSEE